MVDGDHLWWLGDSVPLRLRARRYRGCAWLETARRDRWAAIAARRRGHEAQLFPVEVARIGAWFGIVGAAAVDDMPTDDATRAALHKSTRATF
jgi:hypothetical protein